MLIIRRITTTIKRHQRDALQDRQRSRDQGEVVGHHEGHLIEDLCLSSCVFGKLIVLLSCCSVVLLLIVLLVCNCVCFV